MVKHLTNTDANFLQEHNAFVRDIRQSTSGGADSAVEAAVTAIIQRIQAEGDAALLALTQQFDRHPATESAQLRVSAEQIDAAYATIDADVIAALEMAAQRIERYHQKQMPEDLDYVDDAGVRLGNLWRAVDRVGVYVPGGKAAYPSSVLMNVIPAKVAGVSDVVMTVPAPAGELSPIVLAAAKIAGVTEIYQVGGAQAIAALAYGTQTISAVDMIVGPGNAYVAAAKRHVFGVVGIDMIAGPSEILVMADTDVDCQWVAMDLLSQAEHDEDARSILVTTSAEYAESVVAAVESQLKQLPRSEIARASWDNNGAIYVVSSWDEAVDIVNAVAPEHLEMAFEKADRYVARIRNAGAIFLGPYVPEALGDYMAGPSHVLPTSGSARFSSGLSVFSFLKRVSLIGCQRVAFEKIAQETALLATKEGLDAHASSVTLRLK